MIYYIKTNHGHVIDAIKSKGAAILEFASLVGHYSLFEVYPDGAARLLLQK